MKNVVGHELLASVGALIARKDNNPLRHAWRGGSHIYWADKGTSMLKWAILFFVISLIAGFFGFSGVASGAKSIAKVLFVIALLIFLVVLVFGVFLGILVF